MLHRCVHTSRRGYLARWFGSGAGVEDGLKLIGKGKRKVAPGSKPIRNKLEEAGLADGIPGCSYCVGMSADKAEEVVNVSAQEDSRIE